MPSHRNDITSPQAFSPPSLPVSIRSPTPASFIQRSISRNHLVANAQMMNGAGLSFLSVEGKGETHRNRIKFPHMSYNGSYCILISWQSEFRL